MKLGALLPINFLKNIGKVYEVNNCALKLEDKVSFNHVNCIYRKVVNFGINVGSSQIKNYFTGRTTPNYALVQNLHD